MAAFQGESITLKRASGSEAMPLLKVSADFFPTLGVQPVLGRNFVAAEDKAGATPVAIMSYRLWQERFGANPSVIGSRLTLKGTLKEQSYTVVGILPPNFRFFGDADVYLPIGLGVPMGS
jgi:putative ABC transport system permease protein